MFRRFDALRRFMQDHAEGVRVRLQPGDETLDDFARKLCEHITALWDNGFDVTFEVDEKERTLVLRPKRRLEWVEMRIEVDFSEDA